VSCRLLCASVCVGVLFLYFLLWVKTGTGTQLILQYYFIDWNVHTTQCCLCDGGVESSLTLFIKQLKIICTLKRNMCRKSSQSQSDLNGQVRNRLLFFFFNVPLFFLNIKSRLGDCLYFLFNWFTALSWSEKDSHFDLMFCTYWEVIYLSVTCGQRNLVNFSKTMKWPFGVELNASETSNQTVVMRTMKSWQFDMYMYANVDAKS